VPYILLNLGLFFGFMGLYVVFNYIQLFALSRTDISSSQADYLLVLINASSLPGRLIPSYYADKIGSINVQTAVALASAVLGLALLAVRTGPSIMAISALFGFAAGAFMGLPAAGVVSLSADRSEIGTRLGMTLAFVGIGVLIGNPIAGAILDTEGNWVGLLVWAGALLAASSVSMAASRVVKVGFGLTRVL
jgi:predicted MFS family arabinose efflux permease